MPSSTLISSPISLYTVCLVSGGGADCLSSASGLDENVSPVLCLLHSNSASSSGLLGELIRTGLQVFLRSLSIWRRLTFSLGLLRLADLFRGRGGRSLLLKHLKNRFIQVFQMQICWCKIKKKFKFKIYIGNKLKRYCCSKEIAQFFTHVFLQSL